LAAIQREKEIARKMEMAREMGREIDIGGDEYSREKFRDRDMKKISSRMKVCISAPIYWRKDCYFLY
jgi:hypothetical protein